MAKIYRKPHSYKRKKSILKNRFFWLGILIFIFFISVFYFVFLSSTFQVKKITLAGLRTVSADELNKLVENKLTNKILFFKTKNIFLIKSDAIKNDILNRFPEIVEVKIKKNYPASLSVAITERTGTALWCSVPEQCFQIDNEGIIFASSTDTTLIRIADQRNEKQLSLGKKVIEKDILAKIINQIYPLLNTELKIPLQEFIYAADDKFIAQTSENWQIYFNLQDDINWQMTKLKAVLADKIPPDQRKNLDYIEVRFGNFAPYKYK